MSILKPLQDLRDKYPEIKKQERENRLAPGVIGNAEAAILAHMEGGGIDGSPMLEGKPAKPPMKTFIGSDASTIMTPDVMAILDDVLGSMFPKEYRKFWEAKAKTAADLAGPGVSNEERLQRGLALKRQRLEVEFSEEKKIAELRAQGIDVDRRADADPRAVIFDDISLAEKCPEPKELWRY